MNLIVKAETKTSKGMLSKAWYRHDGEDYLVKGNSMTDKNFNFEPYSEVMASRIARVLKLDCVDYTLGDAKNFDVKTYGIPHVSICKRVHLSADEQMLSACKYLDSYGSKLVTDYWGAYHRSDLNAQGLYRMLVFDALIGNEDRHLNNWDVIISAKGVKLAPILDCGASLFAWTSDSKIKSNWQIGTDKSKPFRASHSRQVALIKKVNKSYLFENRDNYDLDTLYRLMIYSCKDILDILPEERAKAICRYIKNRMVYIKPFVRGL